MQVGRLLCIEWQGPESDRTESLMLLYDGGVFADDASVRLPHDELSSYRFVEAAELQHFLVERLARRVRAAVVAAKRGTLIEVENGVQVCAPSAS